jgi:hypothetical protein
MAETNQYNLPDCHMLSALCPMLFAPFVASRHVPHVHWFSSLWALHHALCVFFGLVWQLSFRCLTFYSSLRSDTRHSIKYSRFQYVTLILLKFYPLAKKLHSQIPGKPVFLGRKRPQ